MYGKHLFHSFLVYYHNLKMVFYNVKMVFYNVYRLMKWGNVKTPNGPHLFVIIM